MARQENIKWLDGLRGCASFMVVITHSTRIFDETLFWPASEEGAAPRILQWPFVRAFVQGRLGVAIFALVTGYVCALKPLRQARAGNPEGSLVGITKSAFRRVPRLMLPAMVATVISWFIAQFDGYQISKHCDNVWLNNTSPNKFPTFRINVENLVTELIDTWAIGQNRYDLHQWTMLPLLQGSILVFMILLITLYVKPMHRMMFCGAGWIYYYLCNDPTFGMLMCFGIFLADLQQHPGAEEWSKNSPRTRTILASICIPIGVFIASYPEEHWEWTNWSVFIHDCFAHILPSDSDTHVYDIRRYSTSLGLQLIVLGIHLSPSIRTVLSNKAFLFLARNSFAVYLLHGSLLRSVLAWMMYGIEVPADVQNDEGAWVQGPPLQPCRPILQAFCWLAWLCLTYSIAHIWTVHVDTIFARWTATIEKYLVSDEKKEMSAMPA